MADVVAFGVIAQGLRRDGAQLLLHGVQVAGPGHLCAIRQAEDEISESELLRQQFAHVAQQSVAALAQECEALGVGAPLELRVARLQHDGNIRNHALHQPRQLKAGIGIQMPVAGKLHVAYHSEQISFIKLDDDGRALVIPRQQNLGPRPHAHQLVRQVVTFAHCPPGLRNQRGVNLRQQRRVVAHIVFHYQHHRHTHLQRVVSHVVPVLHVFDDGQQQARIALPQENLFNACHRPVRQ